MKILQVVNIGFPAGGAEISVRLIRDELRARGHDVKVLSSDMKGSGMFNDYQVRLIPPSRLKVLPNMFYVPAYSALKELVRTFQPEVIHFHTIGFFSPAILLAIGPASAVMTVHGPEGFTLELLPWYLPASDYRQAPYDLGDLTLRGTLHYWHLRFVQRSLWRLGLRRIKLFIAPSQYMAAAIRGDVPEEKIRQMYNGIDLPSAQPLPANRRVLYVGRLEKVKGVEYLIRAFAQVVAIVPDAQLRIVGDGTQRGELEQLVATLGIDDSVVFAGWVKGAHVLDEHKDAVVLAIPSIWPENLPTVCIEAMAVGRAVVGTRMGGIPELVTVGETGYIVPPRDSESLAHALTTLLSDRKLLAEMGRAAAAGAKRFGASVFVDQLERLYKDVA
jgi:glycosyltransferase involved in cell wall biosynthesis